MSSKRRAMHTLRFEYPTTNRGFRADWGEDGVATLASRLRRGVTIEKDFLSDVARANKNTSAAPWIFDQLVLQADGKLNRKGRKKALPEIALLNRARAILLYKRYLPWLQSRYK